MFDEKYWRTHHCLQHSFWVCWWGSKLLKLLIKTSMETTIDFSRSSVSVVALEVVPMAAKPPKTKAHDNTDCINRQVVCPKQGGMEAATMNLGNTWKYGAQNWTASQGGQGSGQRLSASSKALKPIPLQLATFSHLSADLPWAKT